MRFFQDRYWWLHTCLEEAVGNLITSSNAEAAKMILYQAVLLTDNLLIRQDSPNHLSLWHTCHLHWNAIHHNILETKAYSDEMLLSLEQVTRSMASTSRF